MINLYEINEYEGKDLYCEGCGKLMSTKEYLENEGICDDCAKPRIWLTSDWHFCHDREFLWSPRGFKSVDEMDNAIVTRHNKLVDVNDEVFMLGDAMLNDNEMGIWLIKQLKGHIHIICGNHDTDVRRALYANCYNVVEVVDAKRLKYNGYHFFLSHYPCLCANYDDGRSLKKQCISLCGHSHYRNPFRDMDKGLIYHCELDCNSIQRILINKIIEKLKWFSTLSIERKKQIISMEVYNEKDRYDGLEDE